MKNLRSDEFFQSVHQALEEVDRRIADGTLDQSGRFHTDAELEAQRIAARKPVPESKAPAA